MENQGGGDQSNTISRRKVLKGALIGAVSVPAVYATYRYGVSRTPDTTGSSIPTPNEELSIPTSSEGILGEQANSSSLGENDQTTIDELSIEDDSPSRLEAAGLADFSNVFEAYQQLDAIYGSSPRFSHENEDSNIPEILYAVAKGEEHPGTKILSEGWGENVSEKVSAATDKVSTLEIIGDEDISVVRGALNKFAETLPGLVLSSPDTIRMVSLGGGYMPHELQISTCHAPESFYVSTIHELTHAIEVDWEKIKPYFTKDQLASYIDTKLRCMKSTLDSYFSLDWNEAQHFKHGDPLILTGTLVEEELDKLESDVITLDDSGQEKLTAFDSLPPEGIPESFKGSPDHLNSWRYNRLVHHIGRRVRLLGERDPNSLTDEERDFKDHDLVKRFMRESVGELGHYFVGPVQKDLLGMPSVVGETSDPDSAIAVANRKIQEAKLRSFSTLGEDQLTLEELKLALWSPLYTGKEKPDLSPERNLEAGGMGAFARMYPDIKKLKDRYRDLFNVGHAVADISAISHVAEEGESSDTSDMELKSPWGERSEEAWSEAINKIMQMQISPEAGLEGDVENLRARLTQIADHIPAFILALPEHIVMSQSHYSDYLPGQEAAYLQDSSNIDYYTTLVNLLNVAVEKHWEKVTPYISKEKFAEFLRVKIKGVEAVADTYFNASFDDALRIQDGLPLLNIGYPEEYSESFERHIIANYEHEYTGEGLGKFDPNIYKNIPDGVSTEALRYERVVHYVGKRLFEISQKSESEMTDEDKGFLQDSAVRQLMNHTLVMINHLLVESPIPDGWHTENSSEAIAQDESVINKVKKRMFAAKMSTFSLRNSTVESIYQDWDEILGIEKSE